MGPLRLAVVQHRLRAHERMNLAALLAVAQEASDFGAGVIVCPSIPGLGHNARIYQAFIENMRMYAPGSLVLTMLLSSGREEGPALVTTPLGRTLTLVGDACIDPTAYDRVDELAPEAMIWQLDPESTLQAEALLETALDASLSLAGLVVIAATTGKARGTAGFGGAAIVHLGEILAEAGDDEEIVTADVPVPVALPDRRGPRPQLPPILAQRLAVHGGTRAPVDYPTDPE